MKSYFLQTQKFLVPLVEAIPGWNGSGQGCPRALPTEGLGCFKCIVF